MIPQDASTVVLLRDVAGGGVEVCLVQRHAGLDFMGGLHVFPGGKLDATDTAPEMLARVDNAEQALAVTAFGDAAGHAHAVALAVTAVRETLEEAGLMLGVAVPPPGLTRLRRELLDGAPLAALLDGHDLRLDLNALTPLSRWVTPAFERRRFDTRFYLARAPQDQRAREDARETVECRWLTPAAALEEAAAGSIRLAPPTLRTLQPLVAVGDVDSALREARRRAPPTIEPLMREIDGDWLIVYPGDPEHPVKAQAMPGPTRWVWKKRD